MKPKSPTLGNINSVKQEMFNEAVSKIRIEFIKLVNMDTDNDLHRTFCDQMACALTLSELVKYKDTR